MTEHIVALYETEAAALAAADSLRSAGIPSSAIRQYAGSTASGEMIPTGQTTSTHTSGGGFWSWLFGEDQTTETTAYTHDAYDRGASAGNVVVSVTVEEDAKIHQAIAALEAHHPLDIDERTDEVGSASSGQAPAAPMSTVGQDFSTGVVAEPGVPSGRVSPPLTPGAPIAVETTSLPSRPEETPLSGTSATNAIGAEKGEQVLSLSEEQLEIGKRTVDRGTTRIRRYVVEKPVEESVTLRGERVTVERRQPLTGSEAPPGAGAFEERIVEVRETAEEPVVAKTARVVEEVVVGREATERTETVRDTVRREEVEVAKDAEVKR